MAKVVWGILCRKGILDKYTNSVSLIDVIESVQVTERKVGDEIPANEVPTILMGMSLVYLLERSRKDIPERPTCRVRITSPKNKQNYGPEIELDIESSVRSRYFAGISALPADGAGRYKFELQERTVDKNDRTRWKVISTTVLDATTSPNDPSSTEPGQPS